MNYIYSLTLFHMNYKLPFIYILHILGGQSSNNKSSLAKTHSNIISTRNTETQHMQLHVYLACTPHRTMSHASRCDDFWFINNFYSFYSVFGRRQNNINKVTIYNTQIIQLTHTTERIIESTLIITFSQFIKIHARSHFCGFISSRVWEFLGVREYSLLNIFGPSNRIRWNCAVLTPCGGFQHRKSSPHGSPSNFIGFPTPHEYNFVFKLTEKTFLTSE